MRLLPFTGTNKEEPQIKGVMIRRLTAKMNARGLRGPQIPAAKPLSTRTLCAYGAAAALALAVFLLAVVVRIAISSFSK